METLLLMGFIACVAVGIVAFAAFFTLYPEDAATDDAGNPLQTMVAGQIVPQLALRELAGDPVDALAHQAVAAGELETAYATALFAPRLPAATRANILAQLLRRYREQGEPARLIAVSQALRTLSILAPSLTTYDRSQLLVQVAQGLLDGDDGAAGLDAAIQAQRVSTQAPDLLPAQRSQVFDGLRQLARELGDADFTQQVTELGRNPYLSPAGVLISDRLQAMAQPLDPDTALEATLQTALATRQATARQLAERLAFTQGVDLEPERQAMAMALMAEDQARAQRLQSSMAGGISLQQQLQLLLDHQAWLALKARVALQGFGISLVPEWEANPDAILQELSATTANLGAVYDALANAQATPEEQALLRAEALQRLALDQEFGLLPGIDPADLGSRLQSAQAELARLGLPLALPADYQGGAVPPGFRIQPANR